VKHIQAPRGGWTAVTLAAVLLAVEAVIVAESWRGLVGFAHLIGITGPAAWGVPITLDGVSLVAALTALRAELAAEASGLYRATLFAFTGASAAANYWHGRVTGGQEAALYLGGMSIAVAVVFALALRQIRHEDRRRAGRVTERLPRFSVAHCARYPGLTWRAWSLAVRDGHASPRAALDAALAVSPGTAAKTLPPGTPGDSAPASERTPQQSPGARPGRPASTPQKRSPGTAGRRPRKRVTDADAEIYFGTDLAAGKTVSAKRIQAEMHVGWDRARELREHLQSVVASTGRRSREPAPSPPNPAGAGSTPTGAGPHEEVHHGSA
jgi:hypothetical protein